MHLLLQAFYDSRTQNSLQSPIGEQIKLLFLDAVLHLATGAIHLVVQVLWCALQVGEDIALLGAAVIKRLSGLGQHGLCECTQARIAGDADKVVHTMAFTPCKHAPAATAAVAAQGDPHLRPGLAKALDQQGQHRPGVLGRIDPARAQITDPRLMATEDIPGQETVVVVIAMKEAALLLPMYRIIGGVEVQDQTPRWTLVRGHERLDPHLVQAQGLIASCALLKAAQGRGTGQHLILLHRRLQGQILAQPIVIVQVLVPQGKTIDPLAHHRKRIMGTARLAAWITKYLRDLLAQAQMPVGLSQQEHRRWR